VLACRCPFLVPLRPWGCGWLSLYLERMYP